LASWAGKDAVGAVGFGSATTVTSYGIQKRRDNQMINDEELNRLRAVKTAYEADLMRKIHVVGVGIGLRQIEGKPTGEPAIVVSVVQKVPPSQLDPGDVIPRELEGIPVDVQAVGALRAF